VTPEERVETGTEEMQDEGDHTIFYPWQSDLPNATNRGFIGDCLGRAIKDVKANEELELDRCLDRDTAGLPGSPDIAITIFEKIKRADILVADVSFINGEAPGRRTSNPIELKRLSLRRVNSGGEELRRDWLWPLPSGEPRSAPAPSGRGHLFRPAGRLRPRRRPPP